MPKRKSYLFARSHGRVRIPLGRRGRFSGIGTRPVTGGYRKGRSKVRKRGR